MDNRNALIFAILLSVGLFLLIAAPTFVPLFFMDRQLEIIRMDIERQERSAERK